MRPLVVASASARRSHADSRPDSHEEHSPPATENTLGTYSLAVESGRFKSIKEPLEWPDIPPLAVLTGYNGSGKSQLLSAIALKYNVRPRSGPSDLQLQLKGIDPKPHEVMFLEDFARPLSSTLSSVGYIEDRVRDYRGSSSYSDMYEQQISNLLRNKQNSFTNANLHEAFYYNPVLLERAITHHCISYKLNRAALAEGLYDSGGCGDLPESLGKAPWDEINEWFEESAFPYRLEGPTAIDMTKQFQLTLRHLGTDDAVSVADLSSGEASIVRFLFMMYAASKNLFWLKLLLLDEPDSHLHASLISSFLSLLQQLVRRHGTRVIMSTHRVETIGFAPKGSVFIMQREQPRIRLCDDRIRTIGMLSGNLFGMILADRRPVFVEDRDDVAFYGAALERLKRDGRWPHGVTPEFISVADWASMQREKGGKANVRKAVRSLAAAGLEGMVAGLIDRDEGECEEGNVRVLSRYAMENYLLDPIVIYAFLLDRGLAPEVQLEMTLGDEPRLAQCTNQELQQIVEAVMRIFEPKVRENLPHELSSEQMAVRYANGREVQVPIWLCSERGHDLLHALAGITPAARTREELVKAFRRVRMVPDELREIFERTIGCVPAFSEQR
jgi:predicted ATPase